MRCAVHPSRPGIDTCPVCGRNRCRADADKYGASGCEACFETNQARMPPTALELVVRAGLAGLAAALFDGWVETQYVRVHLMSLIAPGVGGLAAAWACTAAVGRYGRRLRWLVLGSAAVAALLGAALAFRVNSGGGLSPTHPLGRVGPPYLASLAGIALWQLVFAAPRRQPPGAGDADPGMAL